MRAILIVAAALAAASALAGSRAIEGEAVKPRPPLPEGLSEIVASEFPGMTVPTRASFAPGLPGALGGSDPARAEGDFNGDGRGDLALILSGEDEHTVVVFFGQKRGAWQIHVLDRRPGPIAAATGSYVVALPPEHPVPTGDEEASGAVASGLHHEALETGTLGRSAAVTHWAGDRPVTHTRPPRSASDGSGSPP